MSYILDALRKAERERHLGQPPTLAAPPPSAEPGQRRFGPWLGVGLGLNVALLAFFLTRPHPATPPATPASPAPAATVPAVASAPSAPPPTRSFPPASTTAKSAPPASATPRKKPAGKPVTPEPSRPTVPPASREAVARQPVAPGSVTIAPEPKSVRLLETLPASARRGIPALNLDIHVHSPDVARRFVVINGRRYREGEQLSEGPVLEAVTRDGAILRQGRQRFRLSVRR